MVKPQNLKRGDKVALVSLSRGLLGMPFVKHELDLALKRLKDYGLEPIAMPNAMKDMDYLAEHPEARASDLKQAFKDDSIKAIITAIGGDDTYKTIPFLMDDPEFIESVKTHPKIFVGYSDITVNHLMLNRLGLSTFYGPCLLTDIAELDKEMLPYTKEYFEKFFAIEPTFEIASSPVWYSERESYDPEELGKPRKTHDEAHGFEPLNGRGIATGRLYGGCVESFYDAFVGKTYADEPAVFEKYQILPTETEWREKLLFLETSELDIEPEELEKMLLEFKNRNIFNLVKGIIVGKPIDEKHYDEYKVVYKKVFADLDTPVLYNVNFGHSVPRCILPYDAECKVDYDAKTITITTPILENR